VRERKNRGKRTFEKNFKSTLERTSSVCRRGEGGHAFRHDTILLSAISGRRDCRLVDGRTCAGDDDGDRKTSDSVYRHAARGCRVYLLLWPRSSLVVVTRCRRQSPSPSSAIGRRGIARRRPAGPERPADKPAP